MWQHPSHLVLAVVLTEPQCSVSSGQQCKRWMSRLMSIAWPAKGTTFSGVCLSLILNSLNTLSFISGTLRFLHLLYCGPRSTAQSAAAASQPRTPSFNFIITHKPSRHFRSFVSWSWFHSPERLADWCHSFFEANHLDFCLLLLQVPFFSWRPRYWRGLQWTFAFPFCHFCLLVGAAPFLMGTRTRQQANS